MSLSTRVPRVYIYHGLRLTESAMSTSERSASTRVYIYQGQQSLHPSCSASTRVFRVYIYHGLHLPRSTSIKVRIYHGLQGLPPPGCPGSTSTKVCIYQGLQGPHLLVFTSTRASPVHPTQALHFKDLQLLGSTYTHQCPNLPWSASSGVFRVHTSSSVHLPRSMQLQPYMRVLQLPGSFSNRTYTHQCPNLQWPAGPT